MNRESYEGKRIELFNLDPSFLTRHTFWSQVIRQDIEHNLQIKNLIQTVGGYFTWMTIYAVNQTMIQRYLTVKDLRWLTSKVVKMILVKTAKIFIKYI